MASSTTLPTAIVRPARVMMFSVRLSTQENRRAASTEVGRDRGDQGCAHGAQEGEDHQYREDRPDERLLDEPVYRLLDVGRGVGHDHDLIPPNPIAHVIDYSLDLFSDLDGVGVGLLDHVEAKARLPVGTRDPR